jgi:cytochrome c-type biogenesis protein CcmE
MTFKPKHQRLIFLLLMLAISGVGLAFFLSRLQENMVYFYAPSDILAKPPSEQQFIRAGGLVVVGTVQISGEKVQFQVTDGKTQMLVKYKGALPSLFRENQGVIAEGYFQNGVLKAENILAKHDEKYMPPEVANALKKNNYWQKKHE